MKSTASILILIFLSVSLVSQNVENLPLFELSQLTYKGGFRLPASDYGISSLNYSEGPITYNPLNHSLFVVGHAHHQAIAEFNIPVPIVSDDILELNMAGSPIQSFSSVLDRTPDGNQEGLDVIGGMYPYIDNGVQKLMVNAYEYYDAAATSTLTTLIMDDASDIGNSGVTGYLRFSGGAGHTSGWISPIPLEWQASLGGDFICGQSSGQPIISRLSVGPSAFVFDMEEALVLNDSIRTTKLLDFSLQQPLHEDLINEARDNNLWTHISRVAYGFIVPGTRTYFTIGHSGGHDSGICYKCEQDNGNVCGGYCTPEADDKHQYYWLWDMQDLLAVKAGTLQSYDVRPYDYGIFNTPHMTDYQKIKGASFDPTSGDLYISLQRADTAQGQYANPPVILVYNTNLISAVDVYLETDELSIYPNPTHETFEIRGMLSEFSIQILDVNGQLYQTVETSESDVSISLSDLPAGLYFISLRNKGNQSLAFRKILKMN